MTDSADTDPTPEAAAPDPGLLSFGIRRYDFSGAADAGDIPSGPQAPYSPFRPDLGTDFWPGLWVGYGAGQQAVQIRDGRGADGRGGLILSYDPAGQPWVSLEMQLDSAGLHRFGMASLMIEAAASPVCALNLMLRLPCADTESGFRDSRPQSLVLDGEITRHSRAFFPPLDRLQPHDRFPHPVLIAFLPLRRTELFLSSLCIGPAV